MEVTFVCVFDLTNTKASLNRLADSLDNVQVKTGLNDSKVALNHLASSLGSIQVDTGLEGVQTQIQGAVQQIYQVKTFVEIVIVFFFAGSALFTLTGVSLLLLARRMDKDSNQR